LLVTVNNRLNLEIEIVHDLSCHPIVAVVVAAAAVVVVDRHYILLCTK